MPLLDSLLLAITAWTFSHILLKDGMILDWWGKILVRLPEKIADPLGLCEYCLAGQLALWFYLWKNWGGYEVAFCDHLVGHIIFVSLTIFLVEIINYGSEAFKVR